MIDPLDNVALAGVVKALYRAEELFREAKRKAPAGGGHDPDSHVAGSRYQTCLGLQYSHGDVTRLRDRMVMVLGYAVAGFEPEVRHHLELFDLTPVGSLDRVARPLPPEVVEGLETIRGTGALSVRRVEEIERILAAPEATYPTPDMFLSFRHPVDNPVTQGN
ncbi:hypothetical protein ACFXPW_27765 [Streptomyces goshikiensis]|uniref:hypothetical protein n=1 Tax=Streptomyces goshikiensis TaxID=1942 RepID=UPI00368E4E36